MEVLFAHPTVVMVAKLVLAALLGMSIGIERVSARKDAGSRTYALVAMGACLFVVMSLSVTALYLGLVNFDPMRISAAIIQGIGFIGAGVIFVREQALQGLTTAAGLWVAAGVGMAVGFGLYTLAVAVTILTLLVFTVMWFLEEKVRAFADKHQTVRITETPDLDHDSVPDAEERDVPLR